MIGKYTLQEKPESGEGRKIGARIELWECAGAFVILKGESNIIYSNQVGGTACAHPAVEGYLVPMDRYSGIGDGADPVEELGKLTRDYWGEGMHDWLEQNGGLEPLKQFVEKFRPCAWDWENGLWCSVDLVELQRSKCGEAWLPVNTPMGPGWLTWENSD